MRTSLAHRLGRLSAVALRVVVVLATVWLVAAVALGVVSLPADLDALADDTLGGTGEAPEMQVGGWQVSNGTGPDGTELNRTALEYRIHAYVNAERAERGLSNLSFATGLRPVARYHSADMANRSYFGHVGPAGETLSDRYRRFDYRCLVLADGFRVVTGGENVLMTYYGKRIDTSRGYERYETTDALARGIVSGWMNSTDHRENLLADYWRREAIGVAIDTENGRTEVYATQNFC
ncbi:CAP domain-containing protein [Halobacteriales archaeon QS_4_69_34]|nr:MAG: CAP domain-containing protein [Halobacteriales archaeon QS_4_69_34]